VVIGLGTAGVPGATFPLLILVLHTLGVPEEGIGMIVGVDLILDLCRTSVNVAGDMVVAACLAQ
jgi:dicarboxylate/amino acid:cation (Na+ or H+) symporter, DAACS family